MRPDSDGRRNSLHVAKATQLISNTHAHMPVQSHVHMHITTTQVCYNNNQLVTDQTPHLPPLSYPIVNMSNGWAADDLPFTNVPVNEAVQVIRDRLQQDEMLADRTTLSPDKVADLLEMCRKSTYFSYGGDFFEQREGAAMGSPVSAVVADLYMEFFEELALRTAPTKPSSGRGM